jgi:hypothetical protein
VTTSLLEQTEDPQIDPDKNYLEELVGDGRKFKSPEDLARGKYEADVHISNLERRMDEMRADYIRVSEEAKAAKRMEELLDKLDASGNLTSREPPHSNEDDKTALDMTNLDSILDSKLKERESKNREADNFKIVMNKVKEQYGDSYTRVLSEQAKEMDISEDELNVLARRNPKMFFKTFGIGDRQTEQFIVPPEGRRTTDFSPKVQKRTLSYYQNMRKTNPGLYFDRKIAIQMDKDAIALGEEFFDA